MKIKYFNINFFFKVILFSLNGYFINFNSKIEIIKYNKINNIKVCVCTLGKNENRYIREFVEHYKSYGIDKIYLYDNNDINGERFDDVISEYIKEEFVKIIDWRGVKGTSTYYSIMDSCYQTNHNQYDWMIFYEIIIYYMKISLYLKDFKQKGKM